MTAPLFSASTAHALLSQSPRHAWVQHPELNPAYVEEEKAIFDLGTVVHSVVLEGEANVVTIDAPDWRTKLAQQARDAARAAGKVPLLAHRWATVKAMAEAITRQVQLCDKPIPFTNGTPEKSLYWMENGVKCRATPDWLHADNQTIDDLKTTGMGHPAAFSRTLWDKGYDLQCALYRRGVKAAAYREPPEPDFRFIVVEVEPPYAVSVVSLDPAALAFANVKLDRALSIWKHCLATGEWPAYPTRTCYAEAPAYLQAQWMERDYYSPPTTGV